MLDETSITLLRKVFVGRTSTSKGVSALKFRAAHAEHIKLIDSLVSDRYIENRDGNYSLSLTTLPEIASSTPQVGDLFMLCEHLFRALRQAYLDKPGENLTLDELSKLADLPRQRIYVGVPYLSEAYLISGFSSDLTSTDAYVLPNEKLLTHESFSSVVEEMRDWTIKSSATKNIALPPGKMFSMPGEELTFEHLLHPAISEHALPQYLNDHLRNAVLDSITAVFDLIRQKTGLDDDGDKLIGKVFSLDKPHLILSEIETESGRSDQKGFMQIFNGAYQGIRNPKAHSLDHDLTPIKAAHYLVLASVLARRVEEATVVKR